jgi:AraC-like DNA-binding protein
MGVSLLKGADYAEDILPDGHHELIFHLSAKNGKRLTEDGVWVYEPEAFLAGQTLKTYSLSLDNDSILYGIRFHPHTMSFLFDLPATEAQNYIPITEIPHARALKSCVTENADETFRNFEAALLQLCHRMDLNSKKFQYVNFAVNQIIAQKGVAKIDDLLRQTGVSQKYFDTIFNQAVGLNPRPFCNIIRLNHFINYKTANPHKTLTDCCYEAGFFDQSHLNKVFRWHTGESPKAYFSNKNYINEYFAEL